MGTGGPSLQSTPTSSTQASYRSLPGKPESSFTPLCLLSNSNLASQASSWFFILTERFYLSAKIQPDYKFFTLKCQGRFHISFHFMKRNGDPYRIRTDVNGVRGRCLNHLTNGPVVEETRFISFPPLARTPYPLLPSPPSSANASLVYLGVLRGTGDAAGGHALRAPSKPNNATLMPFRPPALFFFVGQALGLLVPVSFIRYRTSTSGLSTR